MEISPPPPAGTGSFRKAFTATLDSINRSRLRVGIGAMELCMSLAPFELGFIHTCPAMKKPAEAGFEQDQEKACRQSRA
jgi:hypothetical protein